MDNTNKLAEHEKHVFVSIDQLELILDIGDFNALLLQNVYPKASSNWRALSALLNKGIQRKGVFD